MNASNHGYSNRSFGLMSEAVSVPAVTLRHTSRATDEPVSAADSATRVVTDFTWDEPVLIAHDSSIDEALGDMIRAGVRALLVTHDDLVVGIITSYDIQGERPLKLLQTSNYSRHDEIEVGEIMTPWTELQTLDWEALQRARVLDVVRVLDKTDASHLPVIEYSDDGEPFMRGLISRARVERQLGGRRTSSASLPRMM